jgi:ribosomal protein S18 acetylase RimI-like enzyme
MLQRVKSFAAEKIELRPERDEDEAFLYALYASTREEELALTGWDERTRAQFVQMQFRAQRAGYRSMFPNAQFSIVLGNGSPIGRMVIDRITDEVRLVDLVIVPEARGHGLGTMLLQNLMNESAVARVPLALQVVRGNRALRLYQRLGFVQTGESASHLQMEWRAPERIMPSGLKLSLHFDPAKLEVNLKGILANEFIPHFNTRHYEGDWSVAPLRSIGGRADHIYPDPTATQKFADTPLLDRCPYVREVLASIQCQLQAVRFLRLKAGSVIREHRDYNLSFEDGELRLHIPVTTNPEVDFVLNGQKVVMHPGEVWYCNFNLPHRVENRGTTDRIHLVIDCFVNDWLRGLINEAMARAVA